MFRHIYTVKYYPTRKNNPVICHNTDEYTRFHDSRNKIDAERKITHDFIYCAAQQSRPNSTRE